MSSGGARARSGPAPDRLAIRNGRAGADWIRLPSSGRKGDAPPWPLARPTKRERSIWAEEWARPQAIMWEANGQEREVALYVRSLVAAEKSTARAGERTLILRQQEYLGLSQPGLARNHWIIDAGQPEAEAPADPAGDRPIRISDARERLRAASGS